MHGFVSEDDFRIRRWFCTVLYGLSYGLLSYGFLSYGIRRQLRIRRQSSTLIVSGEAVWVKHATLLAPFDVFLIPWWRSFTVPGTKVALFLHLCGEWFSLPA